jgi:hypothetical protein
LTAGEILSTRLNRPSHYFKTRDSRDTRPQLDVWMDPQMLYRITRAQRTGGVRVLGRLALCDNYAAIVRRLREELAACADATHLTTADRATGLGIRRFRPRVYIVTSLTGGTGSGMFLDLAYLVRHLLRQLGLGEPDVVGLCFLPSVGRNPARVMAQGNAFAALTELGHFAEPDRTFMARFDEREGPLRDSSPPFNRCLMLPLADENEAGADNPTDRAGELLCRELFSPMGRAADQRRAELSPPRQARDPSCQAVGMFRFAFPRRDLVRHVSRCLCQRLVGQWMSKDSKPLQSCVQDWVHEQWTSGELGTEAFIGKLQEGVTRLLGETLEAAFAAALQPLQTPAKLEGDAALVIAPELVVDVMKAIDQLLGRPGGDTLNAPVSRVPEALNEMSSLLVPEWGQRLTDLVLHLIEEPEYRLAGAEEAIRQIVARIERALENHEKLGQELAARAAEARVRMTGLLRVIPTLPAAKARAAASAELCNLVRDYPKWRNQSLVLQTVSRALVGLRGTMTDQLREVNFCRVRLGELGQAFAGEETGLRARLVQEQPPKPVSVAGVRCLLPAGCATLDQAVDHFIRDFTPEDLRELDRQVQGLFAQEFTALFNVCMTSTNLMKNVQIAMEDEVARAMEQRINATDVAALFLEMYPSEEQAGGELTTAFDEAAPDLPGTRSNPLRGELCLLTVPATPAGDRLKAIAKQALPDVPWVFAQGGDEIIAYREAPQVPIADLPQLGPIAEEAYRQMITVEHFTPHNRIDITFGRKKVAR